MENDPSFVDLSITEYLSQLASGAAVPGGGSASAVVGSLGVSLLLMVVRILSKRQGLSEQEQEVLSSLPKELQEKYESIMQIIDQDPRVFNDVMSAYNLEKNDPSREEQLEKALGQSFETMYFLARDILSLFPVIEKVERIGSKAIMNDLKLAKTFLKAGYSGACDTAQINIDSALREEHQESWQKQLDQLAV